MIKNRKENLKIQKERIASVETITNNVELTFNKIINDLSHRKKRKLFEKTKFYFQ